MDHHRLTFVLLFAVFLSASATLSAQRPTIDDFTLIGDTYRTSDECLRLTEEKDYESGSIWYKRPVNLTAGFTTELSIMVGCQDTLGADGMVFVMTSRGNQVGYRGEGIGFAGMVPSIGIEIDTWRNYHLNDPAEDHISIMANGRVGHFNDLAGPNIIPNIEDCTRHRFSVSWSPESQELTVKIDYKTVISLKKDIINEIFGGNPTIYWGMTAATGRYNNFHEVCFDRLAFESFQVFPVEDKARE